MQKSAARSLARVGFAHGEPARPSGTIALMASILASALTLVASGPARADGAGHWNPGGHVQFSEQASDEGHGNKRLTVRKGSGRRLANARSRRQLSQAALDEIAPRRHGRRVRVASLGDTFDYAKPKLEGSRGDRKTDRKRTRGNPRAKKPVEVASLGPAFEMPKPKEGLLGNVNWQANAECLVEALRSTIDKVASLFGPVRVTSTCRSHDHNRRVGGASRSYHLTGSAADLVVTGDVRGVRTFLQSTAGGVISYPGGRFHIDTGPRRRM